MGAGLAEEDLTPRCLQSPIGEASNSSGRPPPHPPRRPTPPSRTPQRPTRFVSEEFWSSSSTTSSSDREDTPWPDTEDLSDFVDLTADSSPPAMPPANGQRRQPLSRKSRNSSSAPSNPNKRRKTGASQSSSRAAKIEEVDLRVSAQQQLHEAILLVHKWSFVPFPQYSLHMGVKTGLVWHTNSFTGCGRRQRSVKSPRATADGDHQSTARTGQQARETVYTTVHHLHGDHERFDSYPLRYVVLFEHSNTDTNPVLFKVTSSVMRVSWKP